MICRRQGLRNTNTYIDKYRNNRQTYDPIFFLKGDEWMVQTMQTIYFLKAHHQYRPVLTQYHRVPTNTAPPILTQFSMI